MDHVLLYALLAALAVLLVFVAIKAVTYSRETRAALRQWAERNGWTYTHMEPNLTDRWTQPPIRGAGSATDVVRGSVPEGSLTCFTHQVTIAGSSTTTARIVGVLAVGAPLPTLVTSSPNVTVRQPHPPQTVDLGDPGFGWTVHADDAQDAARVLSAQVRSRLVHEATSLPQLELTIDGEEIIVATLGYLEIENIDGWVALLRDLARSMGREPTSR